MKKVTLKMFLVVFFQGIWQVLCAFGRLFTFKNKTPLGRVIAAVFIMLVVFVVGVSGYYFFEEKVCGRQLAYTYHSKFLSNYIYYYPGTYYKTGYVFNSITGEKTLSGVKWVILSPDDSLAVFCKKNKRGYFNIYTGKVVIPATYAKAWIFSDGVAAVMENDSIYFIDHSGKRIIKQGFEWTNEQDDYVFHRGFCQVKLNNKYGAVDKTGKIVVPIKYDCVKLFDHNYWAVSLKNKWGVYNDSSTLVYPIKYRRVNVTEDNGIYLTDDSNHCRRYSFTGELLDNFVIYSVSEMVYNTYVEDKEGLTIYETATCMKYKVPCGKYGLMTKDGHPITDPLFYDIEAIKKDLYLCSYEDEYPNDGESVLMNSKGEIVRR